MTPGSKITLVLYLEKVRSTGKDEFQTMASGIAGHVIILLAGHLLYSITWRKNNNAGSRFE